ncbi:MAG: PAS domain S-box protein [Desulfomonile tiedjei]|uniref:histidine kinase n=1 Tax=Desulfomonile tiedjei TaxID=2358 RepID=A0A9D6Z765_9BACT|nr:PAS domain S-box protein [Desulfomonile tiedjei]
MQSSAKSFSEGLGEPSLLKKVPQILTALNEHWYYISPQIETVLGFSPAKYQEDPDLWRKQLHPDDRDRVIAEVTRGHIPGETFVQEYRMLSRDRRIVWLRDEAAFVHDQDGNPLFLQGIMLDITDRKEAEESLRESREQLQTIFDRSPAGITLVNPEGLITFANQSMGDLFSRPCEDLIGTPYVDLVHPSQRSLGHGKMRSLMDGEIDQVSLERRYQAAGGREFLGHLSGRRILKEDGTLEGLVGIITDITDYKKAEEALRESEERFRLAIEATADGVWDWDLKTDHVFRSAGFFSMLGYESENFSGRFGEWQNLVHPEDLETVRHALKEYLNGMRETYEVEFRMISKSGSPVWILSRGKVVARDRDGKPLRMIGTHTDITERKEAEKQIRMNEARLQSLYDIGQYRAANKQDLLDFALKEVIMLTGSKVGYIYHYDEEKRLFEINTWPKEVMQQCEAAEPQSLCELDKTGIWGEAVRQRKHIIVNDFQAQNPLKKGHPEGHVELHNFMTIPVFSGDRIVAVVGAGNKESDYKDSDVQQLNVLMDSVWRIAEAKRNEAMQRRLVTAVEQAVEGIVITDTQGTIEYVNPAYEEITGYSRDEVIGQKATLLRSDEGDLPTQRDMIESLSRCERWSGHLVEKRKDGGAYEEDVTVTPVLCLRWRKSFPDFPAETPTFCSTHAYEKARDNSIWASPYLWYH